MTEDGSQDKVTVNENGSDVDFIVNGNSIDGLLHVDAGLDMVGIGTSTPDEFFHVYKDADSIIRMELENPSTNAGVVVGATMQVTGDTGYASLGYTNSGTQVLGGALNSSLHLYGYGVGDNLYSVDGAEDHIWYTDPTDSHDYSCLNNEVMRLTSAGYLGVATSVPIYELDVNGTIRGADNLLVGDTTGSASFRGDGDIYLKYVSVSPACLIYSDTFRSPPTDSESLVVALSKNAPPRTCKEDPKLVVVAFVPIITSLVLYWTGKSIPVLEASHLESLPPPPAVDKQVVPSSKQTSSPAVLGRT